MTNQSIEDLLCLVEKPSRYLGTEINAVKKDLHRVELRFALAFPDLYEIGTSHFGMQILYHILNAHPDIAAERVFAPGIDLEAMLRKAGLPLFSLESRQSLNSFDIIGFSLLYELNFTNVLTILDLAGIPFFAADRDDSQPMIIGGGPCTCNPEPVADFFDALVVGDGEQVIVKMADAWIQWKNERADDRSVLLEKWSGIEGVYIPSFFTPRYDDKGFQSLTPHTANFTRVKRAIVPDLDAAAFPEKPVIPYGRPVHDRLRLEISRGCTRGCRFCQAGMIYRPARERSPEKLLALSAESIAATGYEDLSLLSLSTGDYGCIVPLMQRLMLCYAREHVAVSLPSLRAGTLTPELMSLIKKVRKTGFTIAPEAGSQRLRDIINKNISEAEIITTVTDAFNLGWQVIKLYFMIGLPGETDEDIDALVALVKKLRRIKAAGGRRGKINVSVATFIPKAHTPFQWAPQMSQAVSRKTINRLRDRLKLPGIQFKWQNPEVSWLEGLWARGDRRLSRLLINAYNKGCRFDGWSDQFNYRLWQEAIEEQGLDPDFFTTRARDAGEPLPWDHIDCRVNKSFLVEEWENSQTGRLVDDCRWGKCSRCGSCDFEQIQNKTYSTVEMPFDRVTQTGVKPFAFFKKLYIYYSKQGPARHFGHLELVNIFLRALKRARITVKYSEGFHPKPKISFDDPLPVGIESQQERFVLTVPDYVRPQMIARQLNEQLPAGLSVHDCRPAPLKSKGPVDRHQTYRITLAGQQFDPEKLDEFIRRTEARLRWTNRKGKLKNIDLKSMVEKIDLINFACVEMTLATGQGKTVRPGQVLRYIFDLTEQQIKLAKIVKLATTSA